MTESTDSNFSPYAIPASELVKEASLMVNARLGRRLANFTVDSFCILFVSELLLPVIWLVGVERFLFTEIDFKLISSTSPEFFPLVMLAYYIPLESRLGRTPGKMLTNTYIVDRNGQRPGFWRMVVRNLCRLIPFECVSIYFSADRRCWHDTLSDTHVVVKV